MKKSPAKSKKSLLSAMIDEEVHEKIREFSEKNGILIKKFVEFSALEYIERRSQMHPTASGE